MANATPSRPGQVNLAGDAKALFLKVFAGEVLTAFEENNIMAGRQIVRNIANGKSAQFPRVGTISAEYHTVGTEITGKTVPSNEIVITIDDLLISHVFIADIDDAMTHFEVRSIYSTEMGRRLAAVYDRNCFAELVRAARSAATITGGFGGSQIANDKFKIGGTGSSATVTELAQNLAAGLFQAAQTMDEKDIPSEGRVCTMRPDCYYALIQNTTTINRDWGGSGSYADGKVFRVAGIEIVPSNHVPKLDGTRTLYDPAGGTAYVTNPEYNAFHNINSGKTVGMIWVPPAIGTVKLMDLSLQSEWDIRRQGTLMVARYAVGHGVLRPECSVELCLNTLTNTSSTYSG